MKNKFLNILAISSLLFGAASCDESAWDNMEEGMGGLELSSLSITLKDADKVVVRSTRGNNPEEFKVNIIDNNTGKSWKYTYGSMPEVVTLPVGDNYSLEVESHDIKDAEFDNPYYKGESATFKIEEGKITNIEPIVAKFSSLRVTINFNDDIRKIMGQDVKVTVKGSNGSQLVFTPNETRSGYFAMDGSWTFAAHFEGTLQGIKTSTATPFHDVKAGEHHIITYSVKGTPEIPEQSGSIGKDEGGVSVDVDYEIKSENGDIKYQEDVLDPSDRPGKEDPEPSDDPSQPDNPGGDEPGKDEPGDNDNNEIKFEAYNSPNLNINGVTTIRDEEPWTFGNAIIMINCEDGIDKFYVDITSDNETLLGALESMGLKEFELTEPGDAEDSLDNLELPYGSKVKGQNQVEFNITEFVPLLSKFPGLHTFKMTIILNDGSDKSLPLTFKAVE